LPVIDVSRDEPIDNALKRFKRLLQQSGVLEDYRRHERYEKPSDRKRREAAAAERRRRRAAMRRS